MDDVTAAGIAALKAGDKVNAATLLRRATIIDPNNQTAWLWLSGAVDTDDLRRSCLERVVAIDTTSQAGRQAAKGLAQLGPKVDSVATPVIVATPVQAVAAVTAVAPVLAVQRVGIQKPKRNGTTRAFFAIVGVLLLIGGGIVFFPEQSGRAVSSLVTAASPPKAVAPTQHLIVAATHIPLSPTPDQGKWEMSEDTSSFDESKMVFLMLDADEPIEGWLKSYRPTLVLSCMKGEWVSIHVYTGAVPDVEYGYGGAQVQMRLDKEPSIKEILSVSKDQKALYLSSTPITVQNLINHNTLLFGFTPFNHHPVETTFSLNGLSRAIEPAMIACRTR